MKERFGTFVLLVVLLSWLPGCAPCSTYLERVRNNEVVLDAWARGRRAEKRGEYRKAKEEFYFVKRFATTYYLQRKARRRYEAVSRILEQPEDKR
ncbi:MAG: hypothetical protein JRH07_07275 [Deltaproteobacteria bacterium]|nr:hypothetical protein [Deltaproteobacteria bacterium]MBW2121631.1 hypothetical protein [Deltaproteobacteria bacterium]